MHEAPLNKVFTNHDGSRHLGKHSNAWAAKSREWAEAVKEWREKNDKKAN